MHSLISRLLAVVLLAVGCASPSNRSTMPKPGKGIIEYRKLTGEAHKAVANTVDSLAKLRSASNQNSPELTRFDRAVEQLELTSMKARARAEAIIARGQNYFDEWKEQLGSATNQPAAQTSYNRLYDHFTRVRQRSSEVREEFRPFMARLRQFRAKLDRPARSESTMGEINALDASGKRVLKTLEAVSTALDQAETELHAMLNSNR